jgi:hypothetical protein
VIPRSNSLSPYNGAGSNKAGRPSFKITTVFGGFTQEFYNEYEKHYPLGKGAEKRLEFYIMLFIFIIKLLCKSTEDSSDT